MEVRSSNLGINLREVGEVDWLCDIRQLLDLLIGSCIEPNIMVS